MKQKLPYCILKRLDFSINSEQIRKFVYLTREITWFDLAQYVQRCPRMFRCWQQITHPFSFSEAIKEKYSHTDRC